MSVLISPMLTEKSMKNAEKQGHYSFQVRKNSEKGEIKKAVENRFGVSVVSVKTINVLGKVKNHQSSRGIRTGQKSSYKKAIVKLVKGNTIDLHNLEKNKQENVS